MAWNEKYWDIVDQYYWSPKYLGLESIRRRDLLDSGEFVCVPKSMMHPTGPLYRRSRESWKKTLERLGRLEEPLNDFFDITFAIAPDAAIKELLFEPAGIEDSGPFETLGKEIWQRYGWSTRNVSYQDGLFVSERSILGVELKLASLTSPQQLLKYITLVVEEERFTGKPKENIALLYITPPIDDLRHWRQCGLDGPHVDAGFVDKVKNRANSSIRQLVADDPAAFASVAGRLRLAKMSWAELLSRVDIMMSKLEASDREQQTQLRLFSGFRDQLLDHGDTGIE